MQLFLSNRKAIDVKEGVAFFAEILTIIVRINTNFIYQRPIISSNLFCAKRAGESARRNKYENVMQIRDILLSDAYF